MPNIDELSIQFSSKGTSTAVKNIKDMGYAVRGLAESLKAIDTSKLGAFKSAMSELKKSTPTATQTNRMVAFSDAIKELSSAIGTANISSFSKDMATLGGAVETFKRSSVNSIQNAVTAMQNLGTATQQTASTISNVIPKKSQAISFTDSKGSVSASKEIVASLDKVEVKAKGVTGILQKMGIYTPTKPFKALADNAEKIRQKYEQLRATIQKGLNEGSITSGDSTYKKKMAELDALRNKYDELILKQRELAQEGKGFSISPNLKNAYAGVKDTVSGVKKAFGSISSVIGTANKYINSFIGKLRSLGHSSKSVKKDTSSLTEVAKKLGNELFRVSKMLKLMIVRKALRAVIAEVGNGFQSLAIHSDEFNNSMSSLINGSKKLGYSFSAMVSPLINALAPAIVYVINLLTKLANVIQQVFGALTGATTWNKAKDFTDSWRDSITGAGKAAKDLKKTVLGFDELNQLQENKDSSGGGSDIKDMFETMPIESKWKELADKIKKIAKELFEPIKKAWQKVGDFVKKSWKYALDEVLKLGQDIARDFFKVWKENATQKIFENIFETVGWIGVAVGNLAKRFREAWNYNETGLKILRAIRDIVLIITEHIKDMAKSTAEWADNLDFKPLLTSIQGWVELLKPAVDAVMGILEDFYNEVVLKFTKWVIESGLPDLIDVFKRFNEEVKWDQLRDRLAELWKHLEPFMETVGEGLIIFIERVTKALAEFINGDEFADFLKKLEDWMDSVEPEDVADAIEKLVTAIIGLKVAGVVVSALTTLGGVLSNLTTIASGCALALKGILVVGTALLGLELGKFIGELFSYDKGAYEPYSGLIGSLKLIKDLIKTITGDIHSFSDLVDRIGELKNAWFEMANAVDPIIAGLTSALTALIDPLDYIFDKITRLAGYKFNWQTFSFEEIEQGAKKSAAASGLFEEKLSKVSEKMSEVGKNAKSSSGDTTSFSQAVKEAQNHTSTFSGAVKSLADNQKSLNTENVNASKSFSQVVSEMQNASRNATTTVTSFSQMYSSMTEVSKGTQDLSKTASTSFSQLYKDSKVITDSIPTEIAGAQQEISGTWRTLSKDTNISMDDIKKSVNDSMKDVNKSFDTIKDAMKEDKWTFNGVGEGLKKTFEKAKEGIKGVWNSIADKLNGEHTIGSSNIRINLPKFAQGGFVEDGLFLMNHHELVGQFANGKTAVANNGQIIEGISAGVYNAFAKAASSNNGGSKYISNEIIVDGEVIARTVTKAQERQNMRYSPSY